MHQRLQNRGIHLVVPKLSDPRVTVAAAQTLWVVLGATTYYFNRDPFRLGVTVGTACLLDMLIAFVWRREILVPLSAYLTAMSIGILLESYDWRIYAVTAVWGILSKYLVRNKDGHFFNPSNFGLVMALLLCPHIASIAPGSQWGADYRIAGAIIILGLLMMKRIHRLELALSWIGGYVIMSLLRMALGQGGLVFALGPMTGSEFALFTFVMLPDPKASPPTRNGRIAWGLSIAVLDGILRYFEIRYSPFYSLFVHCAVLPVLRWAAARAGLSEAEPWRYAKIPVAGGREESNGACSTGFSRNALDIPPTTTMGSRRAGGTTSGGRIAGTIRRCFLGINPDEVTFARRGFSARSDAARQHLETAGRSFLDGYHAGLQEGRPENLDRHLLHVEPLYRGFAYEGAAMALALLDHLFPRPRPWVHGARQSRWNAFLAGPGAAHRYMLHVGYGWVMARLPWLRRRPWVYGARDRQPWVHGARPSYDPLLRWLIVDGYGFHEGYFYCRRYVIEQARPSQLTGYSLRAFDQGLGRSLWFVSGADGARLVELLANFHEGRLPDLWSGIGLACAYAGIVDAGGLKDISEAAGPYREHLAQGASFAAKARQLAGNPAEHTDRACRQFCGLDAEAAARLSDDELRGLPPDRADLPAFEVWRARIRTRVRQSNLICNSPS